MSSMDSRREIILAFLKTRGHATLGEVASHLEVSKQAALPHLEGDLVEFLSTEQLKRFFEQRTARLEAEYATRLAGLDFNARVRELARLATEHGHLARGGALAGGGAGDSR